MIWLDYICMVLLVEEVATTERIENVVLRLARADRRRLAKTPGATIRQTLQAFSAACPYGKNRVKRNGQHDLFRNVAPGIWALHNPAAAMRRLARRKSNTGRR